MLSNTEEGDTDGVPDAAEVNANSWATVIEDSAPSPHDHQHVVNVSTGESGEQIALDSLGTLCSIDMGGSCYDLNQQQQQQQQEQKQRLSKEAKARLSMLEEEDGAVAQPSSEPEVIGKDILTQITDFFSRPLIPTAAGAAGKKGPTSH